MDTIRFPPADRRRRWLPLPASRALVRDILHYDRQVPTFAHDRPCNIRPLVGARRSAFRRISWPVIFLKAYARMAQEYPVLRQAFMHWPWPHLYQHDQHVGTLVVHRRFDNDDWLFWARFADPQKSSLAELQEQLDWYQRVPVETAFSRQLWLARRSTPLRRLAWWLTFHLSGYRRCRRLGTFFLSTISGLGAEIQNPPSMLTSGFTYGPIDRRGRCRLTITYDHRLMDGHLVAGMLERIENVLQTELLLELASERTIPHAA